MRGLSRGRDPLRRQKVVGGSEEVFAEPPCPGEHELHQREAPLDPADRGSAGPTILIGTRTRAEDQRSLLVRVAERPDAGKQQGLGLDSARKASRRARAARRVGR